MLDLLAQPFVQSALLAGIIMGLLLSYLGVHVVGRGIVFVDLALGQISMLGVAFAAFIGGNPTVIAIVFTIVGAFLLSFIKVTDKRLKQEAIIGIIYALSSAVTVLLISKAAHGDASISEVLFGSLFTVTNTELIAMAIVFGILGLMHFVFRNSFFEITEKFANREVEELGIFNLWNFLFYLSIGLAIVLAVRVGGVIPVFSYLVIPPVAGILMSRGRGRVIAIAMIVSILGSLFGILFSVQFDFPAGPSVVALLGAAFVIGSLVRLFKGSPMDRDVEEPAPAEGLS
jgi:zinc/manganese transport system permease protein